MHYSRWQATGDPTVVKVQEHRRRDATERFLEKVNKNGPIPEHRPDLGPCWLWTAKKDKNGYGRFGVDATEASALAHRWGYKTFVGPVPDGLELDHLCRNTGCVNFERHLEPVTHQENVKRGAKGQPQNLEACPWGHDYDEANTYVTPRGHKVCRKCRDSRVPRRGKKKPSRQ